MSSRRAFVAAGVAFTFAALIVLAVGLRTPGLARREYERIQQRGLPAEPSRFEWSDWLPGDGRVRGIRRAGAGQEPGPVSRYRIGRARRWLCDFTVYIARSESGGVIERFPAEGPEWGASFHWSWLAVAAVAAAGCFFAAAKRDSRALP